MKETWARCCSSPTRGILLAFTALQLTACDLLFNSGCDAIGIPGMSIAVRDSSTGFGTASGATLIITEGEFREEHVIPPDESANDRLFRVLIDRPGLYTVTAEKNGFRTWTKTNVRVRQRGCHVETVDLIASLQPS